jgi:hypothetical protein
MSRIVRSFAVLVLLLSGWFGVQYGSSPAIAQSAADSQVDQPTAGEPFFEVVDVEIVNIDVWVTDQQGDPVEGLAKDDFVVYRDGQPIEVTNFYAVSGGRPASSGASDVTARGPVPGDGRSLMPSELEVAPESSRWRRNIVCGSSCMSTTTTSIRSSAIGFFPPCGYFSAGRFAPATRPCW